MQNYQVSMNIISNRFPLVNRRIFQNLDNQSLIRIKEVSRGIAEAIDNDRILWVRLIKKYNKNFEGEEESWKEVITKTPVEILKQLANVIQQYFKCNSHTKVAPIHIAVEKGSLLLCQYIIKKTKNKNPPGKFEISMVYNNKPCIGSMKFKIGRNEHIEDNQMFEIGRNKQIEDDLNTPLHLIAVNGNVELCRLILNNIDCCNPKNASGNTPFYMAAANGHFEVCRMMIDRIEDKNPAEIGGFTPLHNAAFDGDLDLCRLIISRIKDKNPSDKIGQTPLHFAARNGHLDVCQFIIERIGEKNPSDRSGTTPLHEAAKSGHMEICKLISDKIDNKHPVISQMIGTII